MIRESPFWLSVWLLALYFLAAAMAWSLLPERVPMHFGFSGEPTRWARTSFFSWFALPLFAAATAALLFGASRLGRGSPELWNIPEKKRFLALPPDERQPILAELERGLGWVAVCVVLTFGVIQVLTFMTATGRVDRLPGWSHALVLAPTVLAIVVVVRISSRAAEMIRTASRRTERFEGSL